MSHRHLMTEHQRKVAAGDFEPYRPQLLADQVRDLKSMMFEALLQQQTGKVPSFMAGVKHFNAAGSMTVEEEQRLCHVALERTLQQADAGKLHVEQEQYPTCCPANLQHTLQNTLAPQLSSKFLFAHHSHICNHEQTPAQSTAKYQLYIQQCHWQQHSGWAAQALAA